jgi:hypothetical protein
MADSQKVKNIGSGVSTGIRIAIALSVGIILGLFILFWDGEFINYRKIGLSNWTGHLVIIPLLAVVLSFGANCLIQKLSCSKIQPLDQLQRAAFAPIAFFVVWILLYFIPSLRWPVEGLAQNYDPAIRRGLSSAFYTFWTALYTQGALNSLAQICPK